MYKNIAIISIVSALVITMLSFIIDKMSSDENNTNYIKTFGISIISVGLASYLVLKTNFLQVGGGGGGIVDSTSKLSKTLDISDIKLNTEPPGF